MNSIVITVVAALWFGKGWGWLAVLGLLTGMFILQVAVSKGDRKKKRPAQTFRAGVGAVIVNAAGEVLALERRDVPGAWQMPQGGLEEGESPFEAVLREIHEETGILESELQLAATESRLLAYELPKEKQGPKTGLGQAQRWFIFRFVGTQASITLGDQKEFRAWKWMPMAELAASVVPFKRPVYQELAEYFSQYLR